MSKNEIENLFWSYALLLRWIFNPFVPNAPFLYPLKARFSDVFWRLEKGCIDKKWVNLVNRQNSSWNRGLFLKLDIDYTENKAVFEGCAVHIRFSNQLGQIMRMGQTSRVSCTKMLMALLTRWLQLSENLYEFKTLDQ